MTISELNKPKDLPSNPGEIVEVNGWPRWKTKVGPFELMLDIVSVGESENKQEHGIASFVVMEQDQCFLNYAGDLLSESICNYESLLSPVLLITTETKGSHFLPYIWQNLNERIDNLLLPRAIVLRKGEPKVYMNREVLEYGKGLKIPIVPYQSITSSIPQIMTISPRDVEFLISEKVIGATPVLVDDFIGNGGTIIGVCKIFEQLGLKPPNIAGVIGSDGNLYKETFTKEGINIKLLPQPFPLRLPTFIKQGQNSSWQINI